MTAKKAASSAKHKTTVKKHAATKKHTETAKQKAAHVAAAKKAAATRKKDKVTAKAKAATHATAAKAVGFGIGDWLPVCAFEAVARSLRLAGRPVHEDEVAELWHLLGEPAQGVSVGEALAAAALFGLAGFRPRVVKQARELAAVGHAAVDDLVGAHVFRDIHRDVPEFAPVRRVARGDAAQFQAFADLAADLLRVDIHGLILRIDVPGPHAVLATTDGWWSWGELHDPWPCRIEEAWAVTWS